MPAAVTRSLLLVQRGAVATEGRPCSKRAMATGRGKGTATASWEPRAVPTAASDSVSTTSSVQWCAVLWLSRSMSRVTARGKGTATAL